MKISDEIFDQLKVENIYEKNPTIMLWERPDAGILSRISLTENSTKLFAGAKSIYKDVSIYSKFTVLFSLHNPESYIETIAILDLIKISPKIESECLPKGQLTICSIDFPSGKPELLQKLKSYNENMDYTKHDILYLTQKPVITRILELI